MTEAAHGRGRAALVSGDVEFDHGDAALLREVDRTGSVARAASALERSRARALTRIETLEGAFGNLVERQRGGSDGGGSRLTDGATDLLARFSRLQAALSATADVPETVLRGSVEAVEGELATVDTAVGTVRGLHSGVSVGDAVQARIGADAVTVLAPDADLEPSTTSARNRLAAVVTDVDVGETLVTVAVDASSVPFRAVVTVESADRLDLEAGRQVVLTWKATATRLVESSGEPDGDRSGSNA